MLDFKLDAFNGAIISLSALPEDNLNFEEQLKGLINLLSRQGKQLLWLTLKIDKSFLIPAATEAGFVFHNCLEDQITLILRLKENAYAPFVPSYTIGAGAVVINEHNEILVVKEKMNASIGYKLPGGHIELGEKISQAIIREVYEETGIIAEFESIQGLITKQNYRFGKSNMYLVCRLQAISANINIQDQDEIIDARWIDINEYINDEMNSVFNRKIVRSLQSGQGLITVELTNNTGPHTKHEVFFTDN